MSSSSVDPWAPACVDPVFDPMDRLSQRNVARLSSPKILWDLQKSDTVPVCSSSNMLACEVGFQKDSTDYIVNRFSSMLQYICRTLYIYI